MSERRILHAICRSSHFSGRILLKKLVTGLKKSCSGQVLAQAPVFVHFILLAQKTR